MPPRSRQTRNQEAASRRQGQALDLDPTDGLPVQKYALQTVQVNQDISADLSSANTKSTNSAEWTAQFNTPQYPWPEEPVPSFMKELQFWNQELIRRARAGNTNAKLSVWDRKHNRWMSAAEAEKRATPLKSLHLNNLESIDGNGKLTNGDADSAKSDVGSADESEDSEKSAEEEEDEDPDEITPFRPSMSSSKRRKLSGRANGQPDEARTIEVKRWMQLPHNVAEKTPERSFLAARRSGLPPLYNPEYAQKMFGQYLSSATINGAVGYDLGEGGGLNNASGVLAAGADNPQAATGTPARKNVPPRRKKKKLGGPGRRKANPVPEPAPQVDASVQPAGTEISQAAVGQTGQAEGIVPEQDISKIEVEEGEDNDESEAEGSEEGEIDESGGAANNSLTPATTKTEALAKDLTPAPPVTITDTEMKEPDLTAPALTQSEPKTDQSVSIPHPPTEALPPPLPQTNPLTGAIEISIPGLGSIPDPEDKQIIEENAQVISKTDEPAKEQVSGIFDAIKDAAQSSAAAKSEKIAEVEEKAHEVEVDLLGAMDAEIDRNMSESA
ncbi:hypothetical protein LTR05_001078 [Lithohypha guttulata]|uniref:Uncharacterized protein n=1 Tax=Lithohypha guttulata TaxID=1690604 RepID=A0AAN7YL22_9EURO|nr:hypothetical protein LTR05_001078 [Lithohypha guttulata]